MPNIHICSPLPKLSPFPMVQSYASWQNVSLSRISLVRQLNNLITSRSSSLTWLGREMYGSHLLMSNLPPSGTSCLRRSIRSQLIIVMGTHSPYFRMWKNWSVKYLRFVVLANVFQMNRSVSNWIHRIGEGAVKVLEEEYKLCDLRTKEARAHFVGQLLGEQNQLHKRRPFLWQTTYDHCWFLDPLLENKANEFQVCHTIIPCSHLLISILMRYRACSLVAWFWGRSLNTSRWSQLPMLMIFIPSLRNPVVHSHTLFRL